MKQVQAVVSAVKTVLGSSFTEKETVVNDVITDDQKAEVRKIVLEGVLDGSVDFKGPKDDEIKVGRYVNGMIDNHFRKSGLLNGGAVYKPSAAGTKRDPQLRELQRLLKTLDEGSEDYAKVETHIAARSKELEAERAAKALTNSRNNIDTSIIPAHLNEMINANS